MADEWKRYEENDLNIMYIDSPYSAWSAYNSSNYSGSSAKYIGNGTISTYLATIKFCMYSDKLRIICSTSSDNSNHLKIKIDDNILDYFSLYASSVAHKQTVYEKTGLEYKKHFVEIINLRPDATANTIWFDAVDVDINGELLPYEYDPLTITINEPSATIPKNTSYDFSFQIKPGQKNPDDYSRIDNFQFESNLDDGNKLCSLEIDKSKWSSIDKFNLTIESGD